MTTESTERGLRTPTDDEIPSLLAALAAAGGNTAAFARERGLSPWKLYEARRVAEGGGPRQGRRKPDVVFARVRVVEERATTHEPLELVLDSGHRLRVPAGFDETTLRRLMGVLSSC
jgi:hypothetical protein